MNTTTRYTVIGAGHGGKAMAAHLALMGFRVCLYNRTPDHVAAIKARGGIELESYEGGPHGFGELALVTSDMQEALADADAIMVVVPSSAHAEIATLAAPHLRDGQIVVLHPGRTCGALSFAKALEDRRCLADVVVAEAETFIYASRSEGPAQSRIFRIKEAVPLAALPATHTTRVLELLRPAYPQYIDGVNVLHTGLNNMGAIFHPALALLNAGRIEFDPWRLPVLHRRCDSGGGSRAGGAGSRTCHSGRRARHPRAHSHRVAEDGLQCPRHGPQRRDPQSARLLRHQGAQHGESSLHL